MATVPGSENSGKIDWIDLSKGLCIILVVLLHSTLGVVEKMGDAGILQQFVHFAAPFRMPDFFLISGLLLGRVIDRPWRRFLDAKVIHFAYFYVLWLTIQYAFKAPVIAWNDGLAAAAFAYLKAFVVPFGTLWFIYMLPVFFVVTRLAARLPALLVFFGASLLHIAEIHSGALILDQFCDRYVYFFAGYAYAGHVFTFARSISHRRFGLPAALLFWAAVNQLAVSAGVAAWPVINIVLGFAGASAIIGLAVLIVRTPLEAPLRWLGAHSIVVYLAFFLPMAVTREALIASGVIQSPALVALIVTIAAISGPVVFHWILTLTGRGRFLFERPHWLRLPTA